MFIIDKIFNLKIYTKNKNISTVTGFKQFDNNSILNITLLQNNLALDLSNCTVRLNFLREDERVLLYMANIDNAKDGKVSVKLSPEVLEKVGTVQADISVFDSNLLKITSATFNIKVEKSVYNDDTYFTDKDLDLMQQEYVREKERQKAESARSENELERITKEGQRNSNENTRNSNEEVRKKAETARVAEWNNVKKDANNIKNTLETTIDTANKSNSNLQNTINNADKLKQELTPSNYVKNADYEKYKKEVNTQYEDIEKQLKNSSTKTITKNSNILNLENNVQGIANITVEGNTVDVNKEPIVSDFKDKIKGSTTENPNVAKKAGNYTKLLNPNEFNTECEYNNIQEKNGDYLKQSVGASNGYIPQQLFSFDIIKIVEKKKGAIPGSSTKEKAEWLKKNVESITCNWWGYGESSTDNIAYLKPFKVDESKWLEWGKTTSTNIAKVTVPLLNVHYYINNDGFVSFLAVTDASDGKTPSVIYTDYINLEVKLKTEYQSVGEKEKQVVVKSIGKNLIDLNKIVSGRIDNGKLGYTEDCEFIIKDNKIILTTKNNTWRGITTEYFQVESNKNYSFSFKQPDDTFAIAIYYYDNAKNFISKNELINSKTITTPDKTAYAKITFIVENIGIHSIENIQFEEGSKATKFEPYKEDKIAISLKEPLRSLPNGVRDTINTDGTITRRVGKVAITESNKWYRNEEWDSNSFIAFYCTIDNCAEEPNHTVNIINDTFASYSVDKITKEILYNGGICLSPAKLLSVVILKEKLETQDVDGFKKWIKKNPITVYYKLKKPIVESIGQPLNLKMFKDRYIVADTEVIPYINVEYPTNLNSRISTMEEAEKFIKDSLGGAWKTLLMLADKDLKMKSINPLKTTTAEDLKNKINEMLGAWK